MCKPALFVAAAVAAIMMQNKGACAQAIDNYQSVTNQFHIVCCVSQNRLLNYLRMEAWNMVQEYNKTPSPALP